MAEQATGDWLTLSEAAKLLGLRRDRVKHLMDDHLVPGKKVITRYGPTWLIWIESPIIAEVVAREPKAR